MKDCCKDCTRRRVGCHSECADYKEFRKQIEKMREKERGDRISNAYVKVVIKTIKRKTRR